MKKVLYLVSALAMVLFAGSCQDEALEVSSDNGMVTFTVEAPNVFKATKATATIADGTNVDQLIYEVWTLDANGHLATRLFQDDTKTLDLDESDNKRKTTLALELLNDQQYAILFWAQVKETGAYNTAALTEVSYAKALTDGYLANDEDLAAFYAVAYINDGKHVAEDLTTPTDGTVYLRRPFAQLNLGTINNSANLPYDIVLDKSSLTVKGISTEFNVFDSSVSGNADVTIDLGANDVPAAPTTLTVQGVSYEYAAMTYLFAGDVVEVEYNIETTLSDKKNPDSEISANVNNIGNPVSSVPLKENFRTNIVGNLLTSSATYEIIVDAAWGGDDININLVNADSPAAAQSALDNAVAGTTIQLEPNVNYGTLLIRPVDGQENTVTGCDYLIYRNEMLRKVENLTIIGAEGATVDAIKVVAGHIEGSTGYVVDIKNLVIDSVVFTDKYDNAPYSYAAPVFFDLTYTNVDGLTVKNCELIGNNAKMNLVYLYGSGNPSNSTFETAAKNITISGNTVDGIARLCELRQTENVTITGNTIRNTALHGILLAADGGTYSGNVTITGNTADSIHERFVRMAGADNAVVVIKDNTITNYLGQDPDQIKVTLSDGTVLQIQ